MEQVLVFSNDGCLDLNALRIMGVSVKQTSSPIGFFGTGLKYAVATIIRLGGRVELYIDDKKFTVESRALDIRGKEFNQIMLREDGKEPEPLSFTTELGKQWEAWMAVRELLSNARDESGMTGIQEVEEGESLSSTGLTVIAVYGQQFIDVWEERERYFLNQDSVILHESERCEIHPHTHGWNPPIFYKGIRVSNLGKPMMFTYNLKGNIQLTEDRTLQYGHQLRDAICYTVALSGDEEFIERMITAPEHSFEKELDFDITTPPNAMFKEVAARLHRVQPQNLNKEAIAYYHRHVEEAVEEEGLYEPTEVQQQMLTKATDFLREIGYGYELDHMPIVLAKWLGREVYGKAKHERIYLAKRVFDFGTKFLTSTILEELIHNQTGYGDFTRELQNHLFDKIISMGEEMKGECL